MSLICRGKYSGYVHKLANRRYIVAIRARDGVSTRNPPRRAVGERRRKVVPLRWPMTARTFELLAELGAPTYANENAAIKAARRTYPVITMRHPWRPCRDTTL